MPKQSSDMIHTPLKDHAVIKLNPLMEAQMGRELVAQTPCH
jgi:hypothetical protein